MKKFLLLIVTLFVGLTNVSAQDMEQLESDIIWKDRANYFNLAFVSQTLGTAEGFEYKMKSDWGASISSGKTFYLHKEPIAKMIKFGLDWTWFDLNGAGYSISSYDDYDGIYESKMYQAEIGMQVGPSITVNPVDELKISAYFRVTPCYSAVYNPEDASIFGSYSTFMNVGASVAWRVISMGVEYRGGTAKYKDLSGYEDDEMNLKFATSGVRVYIGFRF